MLNENKIKMMTKMAIYEKNQGRQMLKNARYYTYLVGQTTLNNNKTVYYGQGMLKTFDYVKKPAKVKKSQLYSMNQVQEHVLVLRLP